jgi:hypothetical protein
LRVRSQLGGLFALTGQPKRGAGIARQARQEAAGRGIEIEVGLLLALEAVAWTWVGDYAAARPPAMEAVEMARRIRNLAVSAQASFAAADAIWRSEPQAALQLIDDCLTLLRAGAYDTIVGNAWTLATVIRPRNGGLPGALAALHEATLQDTPTAPGCCSATPSVSPPGCWSGSAKPGQPRSCPAPSPRISRRPSWPTPSGGRPTRPRIWSGTHSAKPPTTPLSAAAPG